MSFTQAKQIPACPKPNVGIRSQDGGEEVQCTFVNKTPLQINIIWVDLEGAEKQMNSVAPDEQLSLPTSVGHQFRFYTHGESLFIQQFNVSESCRSAAVRILTCRDMFAENAMERWVRNREFQKLTHDQQAPCEPPGKSSKWSCILHVPKKECHSKRAGYGFADGSIETYEQDNSIDRVPRMAAKGPPFIKMNMTKYLQNKVIPWYMKAKKKFMVDEGGIPGYAEGPIDIVSLDQHRNVRELITSEMQHVVQWWTAQSLRHTATYGIRVYKREAVLKKHVDRQDTHLASAVLQIHQEVDEDGGWPLEVMTEDRECYQVYLQPGEMVLYEGAKFKHGRPMLFKGNEFANVFTHFAPISWNGPDEGEL